MPNRRPIAYPIESPTTAPMTAATPTPIGLISAAWWDASNAALTRTISPGSGMPRLSSPMTAPTVASTAGAGMAVNRESTFTGRTMPDRCAQGLARHMDVRPRRGLVGCANAVGRWPVFRGVHDPAAPGFWGDGRDLPRAPPQIAA